MNTLYFTKARNESFDTVVFLFTSDDEESARVKCLSHIADFCRHEYTVIEVTAVCQTPDIVQYFEPC